MKKISLILSIAAVVLAGSCKKNEKGEALAPDDQKAYIESVLLDVIDQVEIRHWRSTAEAAVASFDVFSNCDPDNETVLGYAQEVYGNWQQNGLVNLNDFKGKFTIDEDGVLTREDAKDLTISYKIADQEGKPVDCNGSVTVKNSNTRVLISEQEEEGNPVATEESTPVTKVELLLPSSVKANITAGSEKFSVNLKDVKVSGFEQGEPGPAANISATASLGMGDYELAVTNLKASMTEAALGISFKNGSTSVISAKLSGKGELSDLNNTTGKVNADISLLGKVNLKGTVDWAGLNTMEEKMESGAEKEEEAKAIAEELSGYVNLGTYFNNAHQGDIAFAVMPPLEGSTKFSVVPVIKFTDGSESQMIDEFFNEKDFALVITAVARLIERLIEFSATIENPKPLEPSPMLEG